MTVKQDTTSIEVSSSPGLKSSGQRIAAKSTESGAGEEFDEVMELIERLDEREDSAWDQVLQVIRKLQAAGKPKVAVDAFRAKMAGMYTEDKSKENLGMFQPMLVLGKDGVPGVKIVQEASRETNGVMRVRMPFYVGESVSRTPGIDSKLYFPTKTLAQTISAAKQQITEAKQPITVYARHAHALSADHLPIGAVVDVEQEGRVGYAVMDIAPTPLGKETQTLIRLGMLKADSLRSNAGRFALEARKVNDEEMLEVVDLKLDGIDFAPDGPAMPTYGVEVLAAEARVERIAPKEPVKETTKVEITLETVRAKPEIVAEIEKPLREKLADAEKERDSLKAERDAMLAEKGEREKENFIREIAAKLPKPEEAFVALQEHCKDAKTKEEVAARAMPVILQGLTKVTKEESKPEKSKEEALLEALFPGSGAGVTQDNSKKKTDGAALVGGLPLPA